MRIPPSFASLRRKDVVSIARSALVCGSAQPSGLTDRKILQGSLSGSVTLLRVLSHGHSWLILSELLWVEVPDHLSFQFLFVHGSVLCGSLEWVGDLEILAWHKVCWQLT